MKLLGYIKKRFLLRSCPPIVEHFALVLGRKPNHSRGVGIRSVNRVAEERIKLQAQIEASEQREAAAQARADAAEQRAEAAKQ